MKNKILFTNTYFYRFDKKQWKAQKPYPPYGTMLAAAIIRESGYKVDIFDTNLANTTGEIQPKLLSFQPDYLVIFDDNFNYLSKMCLTVMREACFQLIQFGKASGCKVLVNSADSTDHYEHYLQAGADLVLLGEAEQTLLEVLSKGMSELETIKGVAYVKNGHTVKVPKANVSPSLDKYPLPAWDLIRLTDYEKIWKKSQGYFSLNIATTRGCPFRCNWCAKPIYGNRYNSRSPQKVVDELSLLIDKGATHFWVCDDIFGLKPGWVNEFKQLIQNRQLTVKLKIQSRADLLSKEDSIKDLVDAGLDEVWIGAESGSQKILDAMDKGITVDEIEQITKRLQQLRIKVAFFLQYGYLGEEWEDIQKTLSMVKRLLPDDIGISVSYPLPDTGFYEKVKFQFQAQQNWENSNDLALLYKATFSPEFYRKLHQYTHRFYRKEKAITSWQKKSIKALAKLPYLWLREQISYQQLKSFLS